jgi:hypothetical protein
MSRIEQLPEIRLRSDVGIQRATYDGETIYRARRLAREYRPFREEDSVFIRARYLGVKFQ